MAEPGDAVAHVFPSLQALEPLLDVLPMSRETYVGFARAKSAYSFFIQAKK